MFGRDNKERFTLIELDTCKYQTKDAISMIFPSIFSADRPDIDLIVRVLLVFCSIIIAIKTTT